MGKKIMICDDAASMRMAMKDVITKAGYTVVGEAANGKEAMEGYKEWKPDLLLLDITMPELDGLSALKMILKEDPSAVVIMLSAMGQQSQVMEAMRNGAKDFLVKPFPSDRVLEVIKRQIG